MCFTVTKAAQPEPEIIIAPRLVSAPAPPRPLSIQQLPHSRPRSNHSHHSHLAPDPPSILIPLDCQTPRRSGTHLSPSPRASQSSYHPPPSPRASQGQIIVISQSHHRSPRGSVGQLSVREGSGYSYGYGGAGPVILERSVAGGAPIVTERTVANGVMMERTVSGAWPGLAVQSVQGHRRSGSLGVERRASKTYGGDPRASNASYRSTRERVVVVDSSGTRREYYR